MPRERLLPAPGHPHCRNYAYSGRDDRLQQAGNNGYTHDENGFRSIWNSGGKYTLYEYAPDYRLVRAEKRETGEAFEFSHDEEGRREAKYCNGELVEAYRWLDLLRLGGFHDGEFAYRFLSDGKVLSEGLSYPPDKHRLGLRRNTSLIPVMLFDLPFSEEGSDLVLELEVVEPFEFLKPYAKSIKCRITPDYDSKVGRCLGEALRINQ